MKEGKQISKMKVVHVVKNRKVDDCCGVILADGLLDDEKFGKRKKKNQERVLLVTEAGNGYEAGQANEQLVVEQGFGFQNLSKGDRVMICPNKEKQDKCQEIREKLLQGAESKCVELTYSGERTCGSGGWFFYPSDPGCVGLVCIGDDFKRA